MGEWLVMCKECQEVKHICNGNKMFYESFDDLKDDLKEKFQSKARGSNNLDRAKKGYVKFINKLNEQGHTLVGSYNGTDTKVLIDFHCGHEVYSMTPHSYMNGRGCLECARTNSVDIQRKAHTKKENIVANKYPQLIGCFANENDVYKYTYASNKQVLLKCPCCGYFKNHKIKISDFVNQMTKLGNGFSCDNPKCVNNKKHKESIAHGGKNSYRYNPNITDEEREQGRNIDGYGAWVYNVKSKANYTCDCCGYVGYKYDGIMRSHHLNDYHSNKELATDINNGVCLCKHCHKFFHVDYMGDYCKECTEQDYIRFKQRYLNGEFNTEEHKDSDNDQVA